MILLLVVDNCQCQPSLPAISDGSQDERPSAPVILDVNVIHEYEDSEPYNQTFNFEKEVTNITLEDLDKELENRQQIPVSVKISYMVTPGKSEDDEGVTNESVYGTGPVLTWWQIVLIFIACLLVTAICCYFSRCCFLVADCCSDPFWGCCPCCVCCKPSTKYHANIRKGTSSAYDLNESRTVVSMSRRSGLSTDSGGHRSRPSRSVSRDPISEMSVNTTMQSQSKEHVDTTMQSHSREPKDNDATTTTIISEEDNNVINTSSELETKTTIAKNNGVDNNAPITNNNSLEKSATVTRNYKRRPTSEVTKEKNEGLSESQPHVYEDDSSYFSIFHLLGRNKRRYTVSPKKRKGYRRNHHIAESRNSAVIPTKISKRSSTASTYTARPIVNQRSKSVESFSSNDEPDCEARLLEETDNNLNRSERSLPGRPHSRSRLSANLADLESRSERCLSSRNRTHGSQGRIVAVHCPTVPLIDKQTLKYFEKSLLGSKETTL